MNNIFDYNKNKSELLYIADKTILKPMKTHFNLYSSMLEDNKNQKWALSIRVEKLAIDWILVKKVKLKYTNDNIILTIYIYNENQKYQPQKIVKIILKLNINKLQIIGNNFFKIISNFLKQKQILSKNI